MLRGSLFAFRAGLSELFEFSLELAASMAKRKKALRFNTAQKATSFLMPGIDPIPTSTSAKCQPQNRRDDNRGWTLRCRLATQQKICKDPVFKTGISAELWEPRHRKSGNKYSHVSLAHRFGPVSGVCVCMCHYQQWSS